MPHVFVGRSKTTAIRIEAIDGKVSREPTGGMGGFIKPQSQTVLRNLRILVVEDEALVAMLIEEALHDVGAEVIGPAVTVAEAVQFIEMEMGNGGISAAVLDLNLDGQSVLPVADMLAARGVPFIFETGYCDDRMMGNHMTAPIFHKPYDPGTLVEVLASAVARRWYLPS